MPREALFNRRSLLGTAAALALCGKSGASLAGTGYGRGISFGLTPVFLTSDLELLGRLQSYLERATATPVTLVSRRTYQEITALLISGQLDAAWICGYPFVVNREKLQLVAVPVWRGRPLYQSYVIVDRERSAKDFEDLRGDIHAFSDPDSNSGYLVTRTLLAQRGLAVEEFFSRTFFTYGHRNVIRAVASGLAASGSVDGYVYEVVSNLEPALTANIRPLLESAWLGFPPIAAPRVPVDDHRLALLQAALLRMHHEPDGLPVLKMLQLDSFVREDVSLYDGIAAEAAVVGGLG